MKDAVLRNKVFAVLFWGKEKLHHEWSKIIYLPVAILTVAMVAVYVE